MSDQKRHPAGSGDGGKFAPHARDEAGGISLAAGTTAPTSALTTTAQFRGDVNADGIPVGYMHDRFQITESDPSGRGTYTVVVPAGTYVLGDPCYVVPDSQWQPLLETCDYFGGGEDDETGSPVGHIERVLEPMRYADGTEVPGTEPMALRMEVLSFGTAYGDGCYEGSDGREYPVDAGMIGLVPIHACDPDEVTKATTGPNPLSTLVTFDKPTECTRTADGTLTFGNVEIKTGYDPEEQRCERCGSDANQWGECGTCEECENCGGIVFYGRCQEQCQDDTEEGDEDEED